MFPDLGVIRQRPKKKKGGLGNFRSNKANDIGPILRPFSNRPHPDETNFLFRQSRLGRECRIAQRLASRRRQSVRQDQRRLGRFDLVAKRGQLVLVREIKQVSMANRLFGRLMRTPFDETMKNPPPG